MKNNLEDGDLADESGIYDDLYDPVIADNTTQKNDMPVEVADQGEPQIISKTYGSYDSGDFESHDNLHDDEFQNDSNTDGVPTPRTDVISSFLKIRGIDDSSKIQFEGENGDIELKDFFELPEEEQLEILKSFDADINYGLTDDEVETVNLLRSNNTTLPDLIDHYKREAIEEYLRDSVSESFSIDNMSDEELFVLDLSTKYEDLTEEELDLELTKELTQPELFQKKMSRLRQQYIELEAQKIEYDSNLEFETKQKDFDILVDNLVNSASKVEDLGGLDLTDDDKNEVLDYILNKDTQGISQFVRSLDDHDTLFKMAWFAVKGDEAFNILHDYYKKQIEQVRRSTYEKVKKEFGGARQEPVYTSAKPKADRPTQQDDLFNY